MEQQEELTTVTLTHRYKFDLKNRLYILFGKPISVDTKLVLRGTEEQVNNQIVRNEGSAYLKK